MKPAVANHVGAPCEETMGFSWHGVVVLLDAMLCDVSLPSLTILHLSAPGARCAL